MHSLVLIQSEKEKDWGRTRPRILFLHVHSEVTRACSASAVRLKKPPRCGRNVSLEGKCEVRDGDNKGKQVVDTPLCV